MAETAIRNISADPEKSEYAKSRLMNPTSSKTQLVVLSDLFADLEKEVTRSPYSLPAFVTTFAQVNGDYSYGEIAVILTRMNTIFKTVEPYVLIPKLDQLRKRYASLVSTLRRKIFRTFREIGQVRDTNKNNNNSSIVIKQCTLLIILYYIHI